MIMWAFTLALCAVAAGGAAATDRTEVFTAILDNAAAADRTVDAGKTQVPVIFLEQRGDTAAGGEWFLKWLPGADMESFSRFMEIKGGRVDGMGASARFFLDTPEHETNTRYGVDVLMKSFLQWKTGDPDKQTKCVGQGAHCTSSGQCCGAGFCNDGHCSGPDSCVGQGMHCTSSGQCCGASFCNDGFCS